MKLRLLPHDKNQLTSQHIYAQSSHFLCPPVFVSLYLIQRKKNIFFCRFLEEYFIEIIKLKNICLIISRIDDQDKYKKFMKNVIVGCSATFFLYWYSRNY